MNTDIPVQRIVRIQNRLFQKTHAVATELRPLGFAIQAQGIDRTRLYCNPRFLLLPFDQCPRLAGLSRSQLAILTAMYFATAYSEVATSETLAVRYNMVASDLVFPLYSDNYMVLFNETAEEFDHICTFRAICAGLLGRGDVIGTEYFSHLTPVYRTLELARTRVCDTGFAALFLLARYILNLALKQFEGFMCDGLDAGTQQPEAAAVVRGHAADEGRHLTTSLQMGLALFRDSEKRSRRMIKSLLRMMIYSMIDKRFAKQERGTWHSRASLAALERAMAHESFGDLGIGMQGLTRQWQETGVLAVPSPAYLRSRRWLAPQLHRLAEELDLTIAPGGHASEAFLYELGATA